MTTAVEGAVRGRPITTVDGLSRALAVARDRNVDLVVELRANRVEDRAFAERVRTAADFLADPRPAFAVINVAGELGSLAERRLRQLEGRVR